MGHKTTSDVLTLEWEPDVEDQLNRKEVNDKVSEGLVNPPERVQIDRLTVACRSA
jgi:hypothetical protein